MKKVLVLDNEKFIRLLLQEELGWEGWEVISIGSFEDLLKTVEQHEPDIIVADVKLGQKANLEKLRNVKAMYKDLPVIQFTAS